MNEKVKDKHIEFVDQRNTVILIAEAAAKRRLQEKYSEIPITISSSGVDVQRLNSMRKTIESALESSISEDRLGEIRYSIRPYIQLAINRKYNLNLGSVINPDVREMAKFLSEMGGDAEIEKIKNTLEKFNLASCIGGLERASRPKQTLKTSPNTDILILNGSTREGIVFINENTYCASKVKNIGIYSEIEDNRIEDPIFAKPEVYDRIISKLIDATEKSIDKYVKSM